MTEYQESTTQERMDLLAILAEEARSVVEEWLSRITTPEGEMIVRWEADGTARLEVDGVPVVRANLGIEVSAVEWQKKTENVPVGLTVSKTWGTVPVGWFVLAPDHSELEVVASEPGMRHQYVTLARDGVRVGAWPRDPAGRVLARRGSAVSETLNAVDTIVAAFPGAHVIEDQIS